MNKEDHLQELRIHTVEELNEFKVITEKVSEEDWAKHAKETNDDISKEDYYKLIDEILAERG